MLCAKWKKNAPRVEERNDGQHWFVDDKDRGMWNGVGPGFLPYTKGSFGHVDEMKEAGFVWDSYPGAAPRPTTPELRIADLDRDGLEKEIIYGCLMINDLIDVGRLHTDKVPLRPQRFDLAYELESLMGVYRVRADDKSQSFTSHIEIPKPYWVTGDSARMRQVLLNLAGNAVKFTESGTIRLEVSRLEEGRIKLGVTDSGIGITPAQMERLFQRYLGVTPGSVFLAFSVSAAIGIFFGFYPARRAAAMDPIEALRYE